MLACAGRDLRRRTTTLVEHGTKLLFAHFCEFNRCRLAWRHPFAHEGPLMKAIRLHGRGGPEAVRFEDAPTPRPGPGEVLVRVRAAAVTPTELLWVPTWTTRDGKPRPLPVTPGHEFSGEVAALGEGVTAVVVGEAVYDWFGDGAQAEFCLAQPADVARKPASVDHAHAAVTPISALTAWQGLFEHAWLAAGQHVLMHGGAGG